MYTMAMFTGEYTPGLEACKRGSEFQSEGFFGVKKIETNHVWQAPIHMNQPNETKTSFFTFMQIPSI